jgi:predicted branched-subunit amino acid permease
MQHTSSNYTYQNGFVNGIPIGLGYLGVSFGFGIMVVNSGLPAHIAVLISMTNVTSAGQVAGVSIIIAGGTLIEMILTQLVINMRYALMGLSLTQKLDGSFTTLHRMLTSFMITDEIFAVASSKPGHINTRYFYGLATAPFLGWTLGTTSGAVAGEILPSFICDALGLAIYGMFLAIIIPPAKKERGVLLAVVVAVVVSCILKYAPVLSKISQGFAIILCALLAASAAAILFPVEDDKKE